MAIPSQPVRWHHRHSIASVEDPVVGRFDDVCKVRPASTRTAEGIDGRNALSQNILASKRRRRNQRNGTAEGMTGEIDRLFLDRVKGFVQRYLDTQIGAVETTVDANFFGLVDDLDLLNEKAQRRRLQYRLWRWL